MSRLASHASYVEPEGVLLHCLQQSPARLVNACVRT